MAKFLNMSGIAAAIGRMGNAAYTNPPTIRNVSPDNWPTAGQPVAPIGPPGSKPLVFPYFYSQNQTFTPRSDSVYTASDLQQLSMYVLARVCIDNTKDLVCNADWTIQLRQHPGETKGDVAARRRKSLKDGDENILALSKFFERPNPECNWEQFLRPVLEDMLVCDAASVLVGSTYRGSNVKELRWTPGSVITRYITDLGYTPAPPDPAYAQLWQGTPRVNLTSDQLIYYPRNIVPRENIASSYLYGCAPVETVADEIKIGISRLAYVMAFYDKGSLGNIIHVVPPRVTADKIREAQNFINSELSGNFGNRRMWRMIPGFNEDGSKGDQIIIPKEPTLADVFDDLHIRKICFAFGTSPQRLQRAMNRASASTSQQSAMEEDILPWINWVKNLMDYVMQVRMGLTDYEVIFDPYAEMDYAKKQKADMGDVHEGIQTRNEIRMSRGLDPITDNPMMDKPTVTTPNGVVELGQLVVSGRPDKGGAPGGDAGTQPPPKSKPNGAGKVNGHAVLVERGE